MGTELTTLEDRALEVAPDLSRQQIEVLKNTIARGTSDDEFLLFLVTCKQLGLNPFALEIQSIKFDRDAPPTPYPTILGRLRKARETGQLEYIKGPFWTADGEKWVDVWLDEKNHPAAAKVIGKRKDWTEPLTAVASWRSFARYTYKNGAKRLMYTWDAMGDHMIGNAALRLFLKRAFGFEDEEADITEGEIVEAPGPTDEQLAYLEKLAKARGLTEQNLANMAGADSFEELAQEEVSFLITQLKAENQIDKRLEAVDPWANLKSPTEADAGEDKKPVDPLSEPRPGESGEGGGPIETGRLDATSPDPDSRRRPRRRSPSEVEDSYPRLVRRRSPSDEARGPLRGYRSSRELRQGVGQAKEDQRREVHGHSWFEASSGRTH